MFSRLVRRILIRRISPFRRFLRASSDGFVYVKVDAGNTVYEGAPTDIQETNNTTMQAVRFEYLVPDLQVQTVAPPADIETDSEFALSWTTRNAGNKRAGVMTERVYFSRDNQIGDDVEIGNFPLAQSLEPNQLISRVQNVTIPTSAITATGDYFVYVKTDADNAVDEGANENNNATFHQVHVRRLLRPDLTVSNIAAPATAFFGQTITVQWTVANNGQGATNAAQWRDEVYLGTTQTGGEFLVGAQNASYLSAGESYIASATVKIPRGCTGSYFVIVKTDTSNDVKEENELNNQTARAITINVPPLPDLRVSNVQTPLSATAGQVAQIQWTVTNSGAGAATQNSWLDRVVISGEDGQPPLTLGFFEHSGGLSQNQSYTQSQAVVLPAYLQGNYQITVQTDASGAVQECAFEDNNGASGATFNVPPSLPDLKIAALAANNSAVLGQTLTVQWTGSNAGQAMRNQQSWIDRVYLSSDAALNYGDIPLGGLIRQANLASGATYSGQAEITIPNVAVGNYFILVAADADNNVVEGAPSSAAENNNVNAAQIALTAPAVDLTAGNVSANQTLYAGQTADVSWTVANSGTSATVGANWTDYVILSRDSVLDATDRFLGYKAHDGALGANASYDATLSVQIPNGLTGEYKIFVITDRNNQIAENSETNNASAAFTVNLQLPPPVELNITNVAAPANISLGEPTNFTWTVQNASQNTVVGAWQDSVYLSRDAVWDSGDALVGQQQHSQTVAPYATYTATLATIIPPIETGSYYVIVRTDSRNNVRESDESNNVSSSVGQAAVVVPNLTLGAAYDTTLTNGQERFFSILNTPADETLLVTLTGETNSQNELFTRYGSMVSKSNYEFFDPRPRRANQENVVPNTQAGTYYTMIRGDYVPNSFAGNLQRGDDAKTKTDAPAAAETVRLKAEILPFGVRRVEPSSAGNGGFAALLVEGAKFQTGATVKLVSAGANGTTILPMHAEVGAAKIAAIFDLSGKAAGDYSVVVQNPNNQTATLNSGFHIQNGGGYQLRGDIVGPSALRGGRTVRYIFSASNDGANDALNVPILIHLPAAFNFKLVRSNFIDFPTRTCRATRFLRRYR